MSCCGKRKIMDSIRAKPVARKENLNECKKCEFVTWLSTEQYTQLMQSGILEEIELPIMVNKLGSRMFCIIDKDWCPSKTKCPEGYWT